MRSQLKRLFSSVVASGLRNRKKLDRSAELEKNSNLLAPLEFFSPLSHLIHLFPLELGSNY